MEFLISLLGDSLTGYEIDLLRNSLYLIIALPIVTTFTGFFRHIIGLKSLSVYAPIVLTFAFYQLGYINFDEGNNYLRGLQFGLILYFVVFFFSSGTYMLLKKVSMHYIPKTTVVMTSVSVAITIFIVIGTIVFDRKGLIYLDIFPLLMIVTLSDTFVSTLARKSYEDTMIIGLQTLLTGVVAYTIISITAIREITMEYTLIVLLVILLANLYIGKFVGLRLTEYYRFRYLLLGEVDDRPSRKNKKK